MCTFRCNSPAHQITLELPFYPYIQFPWQLRPKLPFSDENDALSPPGAIEDHFKKWLASKYFIISSVFFSAQTDHSPSSSSHGTSSGGRVLWLNIRRCIFFFICTSAALRFRGFHLHIPLFSSIIVFMLRVKFCQFLITF